MDCFAPFLVLHPLMGGVVVCAAAAVLYLALLNNRMRGVPHEMECLKQKPWTKVLLKAAYARLETNPITADTAKDQLPPRLGRRYIVTGGGGLVGGYLVLQLLARGESLESIRIVDFQKMHRRDMMDGPAAAVDVVHTNITSPAATDAAFLKPWPASVAQRPLTVFHTAAIMIPSDRSEAAHRLLQRINVGGTRNVLAAARRAGADVLVATASASIGVRLVHFWMAPWRLLAFCWPMYFAQQLDERDFFQPLPPPSAFYSAYAASKAAAERLVCNANCAAMRTGTIRPANGIYGHPTDNTVGAPLNQQVLPAWSYNIVNSFVHGMNCAVAHLDFEAVLATPSSVTLPQAGRPFTVTDPNTPVQFRDLWFAIETLSVTPFRTMPLIPVQMLLLAYAIEFYHTLPARVPFLKSIVPPLTGDIKHLQPPLFSIVTHLYATNGMASRPVAKGGLGYHGLIETLDGVVQELLEWNREHMGKDARTWVKYQSSLSIADALGKARASAKQPWA